MPDEIRPPRILYDKPAEDYSERLKKRTGALDRVHISTVRETKEES